MIKFSKLTFNRNRYQELRDGWCGVPEVFDREDILDVTHFSLVYTSNWLTFFQERHRIDVDCRRTDRNQPMFASEPAPIGKEKAAQMHYSIISPQMADIGSQSPSNEHTEGLAGILLTYGLFEKQLGS